MAHVVAGIIKKANPPSFLLVSSKRDFGNYSGFYYPPAGHIETNEDELTALKREIKEELGLNITRAKKIADTMGDVKNQKTSWYSCDVDNYNFTINKQELHDARFFTQQQMKAIKIWPATLDIFKRYIFNKK
jgi:8-oxo-dGTP pyrophosphatase MutT (NUDIX family)